MWAAGRGELGACYLIILHFAAAVGESSEGVTVILRRGVGARSDGVILPRSNLSHSSAATVRMVTKQQQQQQHQEQDGNGGGMGVGIGGQPGGPGVGGPIGPARTQTQVITSQVTKVKILISRHLEYL